MRALLPQPASSVEVVDAYAVPARSVTEHPFVRCNMICSLDGAITVNGRSGPLGGPADRNVFMALRSLADVIVVGAGTARAENYGPSRLGAELRRQRQARGQPPVPPIAVVTRSGDLDWSSPFFTAAEARPIVFTTLGTDEAARLRGSAVADIVVAGPDRVSPRFVLDHLAQIGYHSVLLEGGPGLNTDFMVGGFLDELCLTVSPRLVAGSGPRIFAGPELARPMVARVVHLLADDGFLFYRLVLGPLAPGP